MSSFSCTCVGSQCQKLDCKNLNAPEEEEEIPVIVVEPEEEEEEEEYEYEDEGGECDVIVVFCYVIVYPCVQLYVYRIWC